MCCSKWGHWMMTSSGFPGAIADALVATSKISRLGSLVKAALQRPQTPSFFVSPPPPLHTVKGNLGPSICRRCRGFGWLGRRPTPQSTLTHLPPSFREFQPSRSYDTIPFRYHSTRPCGGYFSYEPLSTRSKPVWTVRQGFFVTFSAHDIAPWQITRIATFP